MCGQRRHAEDPPADAGVRWLIIVASPIYFSGVTAQTKAWLDRMFPYISMNLVPKLPKTKKVSFIFTQNQPDARLFESGIRSFMYAVGLSGLTVKDHMIACDLDAGVKPPVTEKKEVMEKAYRIGRTCWPDDKDHHPGQRVRG